MRRTRWVLLLVSLMAGLVLGLGTDRASASDEGSPAVDGSTASGTRVTAAQRLEPNPPGCARGYFCAYSGQNQTGRLLLATAGNWSGSIAGVKSVFNNGYPCTGCDHIQLTYYWPGNEFDYSDCIHYNPGPGLYKLNYPGAAGVRIVSAVWRGEC
jgi:Peptidase inhibitor family I36